MKSIMNGSDHQYVGFTVEFHVFGTTKCHLTKEIKKNKRKCRLHVVRLKVAQTRPNPTETCPELVGHA